MKTIFQHILHLNLDNKEEAQRPTDSLVHMFGHRESTIGRNYYGLEYSHLGQDFNEVAFAYWLRGAIRLHRLQKLSTPIAALDQCQGDRDRNLKLMQLLTEVKDLMDTNAQGQQIQTVVEKELNKVMDATLLPALREAIS